MERYNPTFNTIMNEAVLSGLLLDLYAGSI